MQEFAVQNDDTTKPSASKSSLSQQIRLPAFSTLPVSNIASSYIVNESQKKVEPCAKSSMQCPRADLNMLERRVSKDGDEQS
eukprot:IDg20812t1